MIRTSSRAALLAVWAASALALIPLYLWIPGVEWVIGWLVLGAVVFVVMAELA